MESTVDNVNEMPWDIDGDITYKMKSDADFLINDIHNGRCLPPAMGPVYVKMMNAQNGSQK